MATKTIDANMLAKMFLAGAQNIEAKKEFINELNVFPVPDGDTGTNMTLTILSAAKEVTALADVDMKNLAKAISSGLQSRFVMKKRLTLQPLQQLAREQETQHTRRL